MSSTDIVGLIPARGGSKAFPGKNLAPLLGKPLLAYTCEAALNSALLAKVVVSTDDSNIAAAARETGIEEIRNRPAKLSADETPMVDVLVDTAAWLDRRRIPCRVIALLQPTSPLRTATHIDEALTLMTEKSAATVVSVTTVPHRFVPESLMVIGEGGILRPLDPKSPPVRRQDKTLLYARNGPAILATTRETLAAGRLYGDPTLAYVMRHDESVDIDDEDDLRLAALLLSER